MERWLGMVDNAAVLQYQGIDGIVVVDSRSDVFAVGRGRSMAKNERATNLVTVRGRDKVKL